MVLDLFLPIEVLVFFLWIAISSIAPIGLLMSGYRSNNKYSFLGSLQAAAQSISYEIPLTLCVFAIFLRVIRWNKGLPWPHFFLFWVSKNKNEIVWIVSSFLLVTDRVDKVNQIIRWVKENSFQICNKKLNLIAYVQG